MWNICFREYNQGGSLVELVTVKSKSIKSRWKSIQSFLKSCKEGSVREVQFCRNGKQQPSLVSNGSEVKFMKPIVALLPLFEYSREQGVNI